MPNDVFGNTAQAGREPIRTAVGGNYDNVDIQLLGLFHDDMVCRARPPR